MTDPHIRTNLIQRRKKHLKQNKQWMKRYDMIPCKSNEKYVFQFPVFCDLRVVISLAWET